MLKLENIWKIDKKINYAKTRKYLKNRQKNKIWKNFEKYKIEDMTIKDVSLENIIEKFY